MRGTTGRNIRTRPSRVLANVARAASATVLYFQAGDGFLSSFTGGSNRATGNYLFALAAGPPPELQFDEATASSGRQNNRRAPPAGGPYEDPGYDPEEPGGDSQEVHRGQTSPSPTRSEFSEGGAGRGGDRTTTRTPTATAPAGHREVVVQLENQKPTQVAGAVSRHHHNPLATSSETVEPGSSPSPAAAEQDQEHEPARWTSREGSSWTPSRWAREERRQEGATTAPGATGGSRTRSSRTAPAVGDLARPGTSDTPGDNNSEELQVAPRASWASSGERESFNPHLAAEHLTQRTIEAALGFENRSIASEVLGEVEDQDAGAAAAPPPADERTTTRSGSLQHHGEQLQTLPADEHQAGGPARSNTPDLSRGSTAAGVVLADDGGSAGAVYANSDGVISSDPGTDQAEIRTLQSTSSSTAHGSGSAAGGTTAGRSFASRTGGNASRGSQRHEQLHQDEAPDVYNEDPPFPDFRPKPETSFAPHLREFRQVFGELDTEAPRRDEEENRGTVLENPNLSVTATELGLEDGDGRQTVPPPSRGQQEEPHEDHVNLRTSSSEQQAPLRLVDAPDLRRDIRYAYAPDHAANEERTPSNPFSASNLPASARRDPPPPMPSTLGDRTTSGETATVSGSFGPTTTGGSSSVTFAAGGGTAGGTSSTGARRVAEVVPSQASTAPSAGQQGGRSKLKQDVEVEQRQKVQISTASQEAAAAASSSPPPAADDTVSVPRFTAEEKAEKMMMTPEGSSGSEEKHEQRGSFLSPFLGEQLPDQFLPLGGQTAVGAEAQKPTSRVANIFPTDFQQGGSSSSSSARPQTGAGAAVLQGQVEPLHDNDLPPVVAGVRTYDPEMLEQQRVLLESYRAQREQVERDLLLRSTSADVDARQTGRSTSSSRDDVEAAAAKAKIIPAAFPKTSAAASQQPQLPLVQRQQQPRGPTGTVAPAAAPPSASRSRETFFTSPAGSPPLSPGADNRGLHRDESVASSLHRRSMTELTTFAAHGSNSGDNDYHEDSTWSDETPGGQVLTNGGGGGGHTTIAAGGGGGDSYVGEQQDISDTTPGAATATTFAGTTAGRAGSVSGGPSFCLGSVGDQHEGCSVLVPRAGQQEQQHLSVIAEQHAASPTSSAAAPAVVVQDGAHPFISSRGSSNADGETVVSFQAVEEERPAQIRPLEEVPGAAAEEEVRPQVGVGGDEPQEPDRTAQTATSRPLLPMRSLPRAAGASPSREAGFPTGGRSGAAEDHTGIRPGDVGDIGVSGHDTGPSTSAASPPARAPSRAGSAPSRAGSASPDSRPPTTTSRRHPRGGGPPSRGPTSPPPPPSSAGGEKEQGLYRRGAGQTLQHDDGADTAVPPDSDGDELAFNDAEDGVASSLHPSSYHGRSFGRHVTDAPSSAGARTTGAGGGDRRSSQHRRGSSANAGQQQALHGAGGTGTTFTPIPEVPGTTTPAAAPVFGQQLHPGTSLTSDRRVSGHPPRDALGRRPRYTGVLPTGTAAASSATGSTAATLPAPQLLYQGQQEPRPAAGGQQQERQHGRTMNPARDVETSSRGGEAEAASSIGDQGAAGLNLENILGNYPMAEDSEAEEGEDRDIITEDPTSDEPVPEDHLEEGQEGPQSLGPHHLPPGAGNIVGGANSSRPGSFSAGGGRDVEPGTESSTRNLVSGGGTGGAPAEGDEVEGPQQDEHARNSASPAGTTTGAALRTPSGAQAAGHQLDHAAPGAQEDESTQGTTSNVVGSAFPAGELDFDRLVTPGTVVVPTTAQLEEQQRGVQATTIPATAGAATSSRTKARSRQTTSGTPAAAGVPAALGPPHQSSTLNPKTLDTLQRELQPDVFAPRPHRTSSPNTSVRGGAIKTPDQQQREQQLIQDRRLARFRQEWEENNTTTGGAQVDMVEAAAAAAQQQAVQDHEQQLVDRRILDNVAALQEQFPFDPVTTPEVLAARAAENPASFGKPVGVLLSSHDGGRRSRREMPREDHANKPYNQESQSFPRVLSLARVGAAGAAGGGGAGEGSGEDHAEAGLQQELQQQHNRLEQDHAAAPQPQPLAGAAAPVLLAGQQQQQGRTSMGSGPLSEGINPAAGELQQPELQPPPGFKHAALVPPPRTGSGRQTPTSSSRDHVAAQPGGAISLPSRPPTPEAVTLRQRMPPEEIETYRQLQRAGAGSRRTRDPAFSPIEEADQAPSTRNATPDHSEAYASARGGTPGGGSTDAQRGMDAGTTGGNTPLPGGLAGDAGEAAWERLLDSLRNHNDLQGLQQSQPGVAAPGGQQPPPFVMPPFVMGGSPTAPPGDVGGRMFFDQPPPAILAPTPKRVATALNEAAPGLLEEDQDTVEDRVPVTILPPHDDDLGRAAAGPAAGAGFLQQDVGGGLLPPLPGGRGNYPPPQQDHLQGHRPRPKSAPPAGDRDPLAWTREMPLPPPLPRFSQLYSSGRHQQQQQEQLQRPHSTTPPAFYFPVPARGAGGAAASAQKDAANLLPAAHQLKTVSFIPEEQPKLPMQQVPFSPQWQELQLALQRDELKIGPALQQKVLRYVHDHVLQQAGAGAFAQKKGYQEILDDSQLSNGDAPVPQDDTVVQVLNQVRHLTSLRGSSSLGDFDWLERIPGILGSSTAGSRQSSAAGSHRGSSAVGGATDSDDIAEKSPFRTTRPFKELMLYREFVHRSSQAVLGNLFTSQARVIISERDYDTIAILRRKTAFGQAQKYFQNEMEEEGQDQNGEENQNPQTRNKSSFPTAESFSSPPRGAGTLSPEQELGGEQRAAAQDRSASASVSSAAAAAQAAGDPAAVDPAAADAAVEERREKRKRNWLLDRDNENAVEYLISVKKVFVGRGPSTTATSQGGGTNEDLPAGAGMNSKAKPKFTGASRPLGSSPSEVDHDVARTQEASRTAATSGTSSTSAGELQQASGAETWVEFAIHIPDIGFFEPGLLPLFRGEQDTDTTTRPADEDDITGSTEQVEQEHQQHQHQHQQNPPVKNSHRSLSALVTDSYDKNVQAEFRRSIPLYHLRRLFAIMTLDNVKKTHLPSSGSSSSTRRQGHGAAAAGAPTSRRSGLSKRRSSSKRKLLVERLKQQKQEEKDDNDLDKNSPPTESYILTNTLFFEVRIAPLHPVDHDQQAAGHGDTTSAGAAGPSAGAGGAVPRGVRASNIRNVRLVRNTAVRNGAQIAIDRDLVFPSRTSASGTRTTGHVSSKASSAGGGAAATVRHNTISPGSAAGATLQMNVSPGSSAAGGRSSSAGASSSAAQATTPVHDQHIRSNERLQPAAPFTDQGSLAKLLFTALQHLPIASFDLYKHHLSEQIQEMKLFQNLEKKYPQTWRMLNPAVAGGTQEQPQQEMTSPPGADGNSRRPSVGDHTLDTRTLDQETPPTRQTSTLDESSTVVGTEVLRTPASLGDTPGTGAGGGPMTPNTPNSRSVKNVFEDLQRGLQAAQYLALQKVGLVTPFTKAFDASVQIAAHYSTYARLPGRRNEQDQSPGKFLLEQTDQRNIVVVDLNLEKQTVLVYLPREKYHVDTKDEEAAGARQRCAGGAAGSSSSAASTSAGGLGSPPVPMHRRAQQQQAVGAPLPAAFPPLHREQFTHSRTTSGESYRSSASPPDYSLTQQPPGSPKRSVQKSPEELLEGGDPRFQTPQRPKKGEQPPEGKKPKPQSGDMSESTFAWRQNISPGARSEGSTALPPHSPEEDLLDGAASASGSVGAGSRDARTSARKDSRSRKNEVPTPKFGPWGEIGIAMGRSELRQQREKRQAAEAAAAALEQGPAGVAPAADIALEAQDRQYSFRWPPSPPGQTPQVGGLEEGQHELPAGLQSVTTSAAAVRVVLDNPIVQPVIPDTTGGASSEQQHGDEHVPPLLHPGALFNTPVLPRTTTPPPVVPAGLSGDLAGALAARAALNNNDVLEQGGGRAATPTFGSGGTEAAGTRTTMSGRFFSQTRPAGQEEHLVQEVAGPLADEPLPVVAPLPPPSTPRAARAPTPSFGQADEHPEASSSLPAPGEQTPRKSIRAPFFYSPEKDKGGTLVGQPFTNREERKEQAEADEAQQAQNLFAQRGGARAQNLFAQVGGRGGAPPPMPPPFSLPPGGISMTQQESSSAAAAAAAARAPGGSTGSADEVGVVGTSSSEDQRGHLMPTSRCSAAAEVDQQEQPGATPGGPHVEHALGYQPGGNGDPNIATCAAAEEVVVERPSPGAEAPQAVPAGSSPKDFRLVRDQLQLQQRGQHHQQPTQFAFPTSELQPAEPGLVVPQLPPARPDYAQQQEQSRSMFNIPSSAASAAGLSSSASDAGVVAVSGLRETATLVDADGIAHYGKHNEPQGTTTHDPHNHRLHDPFATPDRPALRRGRSADSSALSGAAGASAVLGHRSATSIYSKQEDKGYIAGDFCEHQHASDGQQQAAGNKPNGSTPTSSTSILKQRADKPHGFALEISIRELRRAQLSAFGQAVPAEDGSSAGSTIQPDRPEGGLRFALRDGIGVMRHKVASFSTIKAVAPPATAGTASAASGGSSPSPSPWVLYKRTVSRQAEAFLFHSVLQLGGPEDDLPTGAQEVCGLSPSAASEVLKRELQRRREMRSSSSSSSQIEVGATADASHPLDLVLPIKEKLKLYEGYPAQIFHSYNLMSLGAAITKQQMHDQLLHVLQKIIGTRMGAGAAPPVSGPAEGGGPLLSEVAAAVGGHVVEGGRGPTVDNDHRPAHGAPLLSPQYREDDEASIAETVELFGTAGDRQRAMELVCQALIARMQEVVQQNRRPGDSSATGSAGNSVVGHADDFGTILPPVDLDQVRREAPPPDVNPEHVRACLAGLEEGGAGGPPPPVLAPAPPQVVLQPARPAGELQADDGTTSERGSVDNLSDFQLPSPAVLPSSPSPPREDPFPSSSRVSERQHDHRPSAALSEAVDRAERAGRRNRSIEEAVVRSRAAQGQEGEGNEQQQQLGRVDGELQQEVGPRGRPGEVLVDAPPLQTAEWRESLEPHLEEQRHQRPAVPHGDEGGLSPPRTPRRGPSPSERRANQLQVSPQQLRTDAFGILGGSGSGSPSRSVSRTPDVVRRMRDEAAPHEHQLQPAALQQHGSPLLPQLQIDVALQAEQENDRLLGQHLAAGRSASRGLQAPLHHEIPQDSDSTGSPAASVSPEDEMNLGIGDEQQDEQQLAAGGKNMKDETETTTPGDDDETDSNLSWTDDEWAIEPEVYWDPEDDEDEDWDPEYDEEQEGSAAAAAPAPEDVDSEDVNKSIMAFAKRRALRFAENELSRNGGPQSGSGTGDDDVTSGAAAAGPAASGEEAGQQHVAAGSAALDSASTLPAAGVKTTPRAAAAKAKAHPVVEGLPQIELAELQAGGPVAPAEGAAAAAAAAASPAEGGIKDEDVSPASGGSDAEQQGESDLEEQDGDGKKLTKAKQREEKEFDGKPVTKKTHEKRLRRQLEDLDKQLIDPTSFFINFSTDDAVKLSSGQGAFKRSGPTKIWSIQDLILRDALQRDGSAAAGQDVGAGGGPPSSSTTANLGGQTQTMTIVQPPVAPETGEEQEVDPMDIPPGPEGSLRIHAIIGGPYATHDATGRRIHSSVTWRGQGQPLDVSSSAETYEPISPEERRIRAHVWAVVRQLMALREEVNGYRSSNADPTRSTMNDAQQTPSQIAAQADAEGRLQGLRNRIAQLDPDERQRIQAAEEVLIQYEARREQAQLLQGAGTATGTSAQLRTDRDAAVMAAVRGTSSQGPRDSGSSTSGGSGGGSGGAGGGASTIVPGSASSDQRQTGTAVSTTPGGTTTQVLLPGAGTGTGPTSAAGTTTGPGSSSSFGGTTASGPTDGSGQQTSSTPGGTTGGGGGASPSTGGSSTAPSTSGGATTSPTVISAVDPDPPATVQQPQTTTGQTTTTGGQQQGQTTPDDDLDPTLQQGQQGGTHTTPQQGQGTTTQQGQGTTQHHGQQHQTPVQLQPPTASTTNLHSGSVVAPQVHKLPPLTWNPSAEDSAELFFWEDDVDGKMNNTTPADVISKQMNPGLNLNALEADYVLVSQFDGDKAADLNLAPDVHIVDQKIGQDEFKFFVYTGRTNTRNNRMKQQQNQNDQMNLQNQMHKKNTSDHMVVVPREDGYKNSVTAALSKTWGQLTRGISNVSTEPEVDGAPQVDSAESSSSDEGAPASWASQEGLVLVNNQQAVVEMNAGGSSSLYHDDGAHHPSGIISSSMKTTSAEQVAQQVLEPSSAYRTLHNKPTWPPPHNYLIRYPEEEQSWVGQNATLVIGLTPMAGVTVLLVWLFFYAK
ncbi:unnamed protein product [Amoebophrya sp. A120]|nr:unnamed protein product [Amoebophrya sp. A120]|eukprot:GSA120T00021135001.1